MIDFTRMIARITPEEDGEDVLRLRTGEIDAVGTDGATDVLLSGVVTPDVPSLGGATFAVGTSVQILSYRASLLILGPSGGVTSQPEIATGTGGASGTTTSTSFVNTLTGVGAAGGAHGTAFVAPPSGTVFVIGRAVAGRSVAGDYTLMDFEVREGSTVGSGSVFRAADENQASAIQSGTAGNQGEHCTTGIVTGLIPGAVYNACLTYRITGGSGTGSWNRRHIIVLPQ